MSPRLPRIVAEMLLRGALDPAKRARYRAHCGGVRGRSNTLLIKSLLGVPAKSVSTS
jgi:hypothetical protein